VDDKKYIGVTEFSRLSKLSRQTVYNKLSNELSDYVKIIDGKNVIDSEALQLFVKEDDNVVQNDSPIDVNSLVVFLQNQILTQQEEHRQQINVKDLQIAELNNRLREANQIHSNNQVLLLGTQETKQIEPPAKKKWQFWK